MHNTEKTLSKCINSILKQNFSKSEIILINDGSTDKSKKTYNSFKRKFKGIKIFNHRKKLGVSASRNKGIKEAKGDFLIFLDSDDFLLNGCLNKLSNLVKKNTLSDLIIAKKFITLSMPNTFITHRVFNTKSSNKKNTDQLINKLNSKRHVYGNIYNYIINRNFLIKKRIYFTPKIEFGEDQEFIIKILCLCNKFCFYNNSFYCYSSGIGNLSNSMSFNTGLSCLRVVNNLCELIKLHSLSKIKKNYIKKIIKKVLNQFIPRLIYFEKNKILQLSRYIKSKRKNFNLIKFSFTEIEMFSNLKKYGFNKGLLLYRNKIINKLLLILKEKAKIFNQIYIFCYGYNGIAISKILIENGYCVKGFLDNNKLLTKNKILGLKVYSPYILEAKTINCKSNILIIICNQFISNMKNIRNQLMVMGIKKKQIVFNYNK